MSTELQVAGPRFTIAETETMAKAVSSSRLFPGVETPQAAMVLMLLCEAEGLHPIQALRRFHLIENRPSMRADAMQAEFQRHGGRVEWLCSNREECRAVFTHRDYAPKGFEVHVTFAELDAAGVTRGKYGVKDNWRKFPRQMLRARAISEGVRAVDPGIVVGVYTPEEISDFDSREVSLETTARVVEQPKPERERVVIERPTQFDAPRVQDRHQAPAAVAEEMAAAEHVDQAVLDGYASVILRDVDSVNEYWRNCCHEDGVTYSEVVNTFQVENHLATWAIEQGRITEDYIAGESGKRSRPKLIKLLSKWNAKHAEEFRRLVGEYCGNKLKEVGTKAGVLVNIHEEGDPEPEDESQEVEADAEAESGVEA